MSETLEDGIMAVPTKERGLAAASRVEGPLRTLRAHIGTVLLIAASFGAPEAPVPAAEPQGPQKRVPSRADWQNSPEFKAALKALDAEIRQLNNDKFSERQAAQGIVDEMVEQQIRMCNPPPAALRDRLWPWKKDTRPVGYRQLYMKDGVESLEQAVRMDQAVRRFDELRLSLPDILPPGTYDLPRLVGLIEVQTGFVIRMEQTLEFHRSQIEIRAGQNDLAQTLNALSQHAQAVPCFDDEKTIVFASAKPDAPKSSFVTNNRVLGILEKDRESPEKRHLELRAPPRNGTIVHIQNAAAYDRSLSGVGTRALSIESWTMHSSQRMPQRSQAVSGHPPTDTPYDALAARVTMARARQSVTLKPGSGGEALGFQLVEATDESGNGIWRLGVEIVLLPPVPWPETPGLKDTETYAAADMNTYRVRDAAGKVIGSKIASCDVTERVMKVTLVCDAKPDSVDVTGFSELDEGVDLRLQLPPEPLDLGKGSPALEPLDPARDPFSPARPGRRRYPGSTEPMLITPLPRGEE